MTAENTALLDAIRVIVRDEVAPLSGRIDRLEGRFDGLEGRFDGLEGRLERVEAEQQVQRRMLHNLEASIDERFTHLDLRLTNLEAISMRLENEVGTLDMRTNRMAGDLADLLELQDKVNEGFRAFKSDFQRAFVDIGAVQDAQKGQQRQMKQLRERVDVIERRLAKLEGSE